MIHHPISRVRSLTGLHTPPAMPTAITWWPGARISCPVKTVGPPTSFANHRPTLLSATSLCPVMAIVSSPCLSASRTIPQGVSPPSLHVELCVWKSAATTR